MALNDIFRIKRQNNQVIIEIRPGVAQLVINEGYIRLPLDPADEGTNEAFTMWGNTSTGKIKIRDGAGIRDL